MKDGYTFDLTKEDALARLITAILVTYLRSYDNAWASSDPGMPRGIPVRSG